MATPNIYIIYIHIHIHTISNLYIDNWSQSESNGFLRGFKSLRLKGNLQGKFLTLSAFDSSTAKNLQETKVNSATKRFVSPANRISFMAWRVRCEKVSSTQYTSLMTLVCSCLFQCNQNIPNFYENIIPKTQKVWGIPVSKKSLCGSPTIVLFNLFNFSKSVYLCIVGGSKKNRAPKPHIESSLAHQRSSSTTPCPWNVYTRLTQMKRCE